MNYQLFNDDCLAGMKKIESGSVDAIICDPPYNLTDCAWDKSVIDLAAMWSEFKRILKPCSATVLFASGKFTHKLIASNFDWYKYKWIWVKNAPTMFVHAKNAPMRKFEEICVFSNGVVNHKTVSEKRMPYNPQGLVPCGFERYENGADKPSQLRAGGRGAKWDGIYDDCASSWRSCSRNKVNVKTGKNATKTQIHNPHPENIYIQEQTGYPVDVLYYNVEPANKKIHPTQKPVDLLEYLIRTYTNEGELVLDATMGSGSTGVAAINTGRRFIGFELEKKFYDTAEKRISEALAIKQQEFF